MVTKEMLAKPFDTSNPLKVFVAVLLIALLAGTATGYVLAANRSTGGGSALTGSTDKPPAAAQQDTRTFRDFAEGKVTKKPDPKPGEEYTEGTHMLVRKNAVPVALTSSVVDLSQYEGKNVKVFGETQKAIKEGWLMDVGRVEEK